MATLHVFVSRICTVAFSGRLLHSTTRRPKLCRSCRSWTGIALNAGAAAIAEQAMDASLAVLSIVAPPWRLTLIGRPGAHRFGVLRFKLMVKRGPRAERVDHWLMALGRLLLCRRRQRDRGLTREQQEGQRLLEIKAHDAVGVAQIADREILPDVQIEITAPRGEHEGAGDGWRPDDLVLDELFDMLQHGIPVVTGLSERRIRLGAEQH